jgi:SpoIID/LytB domain protein
MYPRSSSQHSASPAGASDRSRLAGRPSLPGRPGLPGRHRRLGRLVLGRFVLGRFVRPGNIQPENIQTGNIQTGNIQPENIQTGNIQTGNVGPGNIRPGNVGPGKPLRLVTWGLATALTAAMLVPAIPAQAGDQLYAVPASGVFTVTGHGFGHGHGMSQYGARGAASRGLTARQITDFYYPGTTLTANGNPVMRIRLSAVEAQPVMVKARTGMSIVDGVHRSWALGTDTTSWRIAWVSSSGRFAVQKWSAGQWSTSMSLPGPVQVKVSSGSVTVQFGRNKNDCKRLPEVSFPGTLRVVMASGAQRSVADLSRENYLQGVVSSEMPSYWPAAALQAQAIAARSYAGYKINLSNWYDAWDTTADQCWDGDASKLASTNSAVAATQFQVRMYGGRPAFTQFASSNGGYSAAGSVPYLVAKADPYEQYGGNPYATWSKSVTSAQLASFAGLKKVTRVRVTARSGGGDWGGWVLNLAVDGVNSAGSSVSVAKTGGQFRSAFSLKSAYFSFGGGTAATPPPPPGPTWKLIPTIWRRSTATWWVKGRPPQAQGTATSIPFVTDVDGDHKLELTTFDRTARKWTVGGVGVYYWGLAGDLPVTGDVNHDGKTDLGVYRPSTGEWLMRGLPVVNGTVGGDYAFLGDVTGDDMGDYTSYRTSDRVWSTVGVAPVVWGLAGDVPVPADFDGNGKDDLAIWRPSTGQWWIKGSLPVTWGVPAAGDIPRPADYDGDGKADLAVYRGSTGTWWAKGLPPVVWGLSSTGDVPVVPMR